MFQRKASPNGLFSTELDDVLLKLAKMGRPQPNDRELKLEFVRCSLAAAEALILAPKVTFKTYGENVVLSSLATAIGLKGIRELLEEGGLEFTLWQSFPAHWSDTPAKPAPKGLNPLAPISLSSSAHSDPLASAEMGLRGWAPWMLASDAKVIARLAAERTTIVDPKLAPLACRKAEDAYAKGLLRADGLDPIPFDTMTEVQRVKLNGFADRLHRAATALGQRLNVHDDASGWAALTTACARLQDAERVIEVGEEVFRLERIPSISALLLHQLLGHADIPQIRRRKETAEFRDWLWSQPDPTDAAKVSEAYLAEMAPKADLKDNRWFKAIRIAVVGIAGTAAGLGAAALAGPGVGVAVGLGVSTAAGVAVSEADGFWLESLLTKPNPRRLATDVLTPLITARTMALADLPTATAEDARSATSQPWTGGYRVAFSPNAPLGNVTPTQAPSPRESAGDDAQRRDRNRRKAQRKAQRDARHKSRKR